ncbi:glycoside hydrolase family 26 protein [Gephyromycinifex aptenodytis]|uniref:hypothetical protein n=1 Tax=Gephyromycinifex aptenodytis TaxID=2716227 RepID=UPI00144896C1|nr:hypothetical protein [Gephyromycinifex aptenodytis]
MQNIVVSAAVALVLAGAPAAQAATMSAVTPTNAGAGYLAATRRPPGYQAKRYLGTSRSVHPWHSGAWTGGWMSDTRATKWGTWRGTPSDAAMTFPEKRTWAAISNSTWHIDTYRNFRGTLVYGMPLMPSTNKPVHLKSVAAGRHDAVFRKVARDLRTRYKGKTVVRLGWEANGNWMSYSATAKNAGDYRAAYRRAAKVMKKENPSIVMSFDINCGTPLTGQRSRLDSLTKLYPGDDVVDLVGCSWYDWDVIGAKNERQWRSALQPRYAVGPADITNFARAHNKGASFPEWGLAHAWDGNGDNPFFMTKVKQFFTANADVLVLECYFNVPEKPMLNSLWSEAPQNPKAAAVYRRLW